MAGTVGWSRRGRFPEAPVWGRVADDSLGKYRLRLRKQHKSPANSRRVYFRVDLFDVDLYPLHLQWFMRRCESHRLKESKQHKWIPHCPHCPNSTASSVLIGRFCMTKAGPHDNGGGHPSPHLPEPIPESHKVMAYCDVHIHLCTPTRPCQVAGSHRIAPTCRA